MYCCERMNPDHQEEAQRLLEFRQRALYLQSNQNGATSWSNGQSSGASAVPDATLYSQACVPPVQDPLIYTDLYAPSGIDMMSILLAVRQRPNPTYNLGNIDSGTALVLCDPDVPEMPIVYYSEPFATMTGYGHAEIMGKNCRFLQQRPRCVRAHSLDVKERKINDEARKKLHDRIGRGKEAQVEIVNYRSNGEKFLNVLTIVPIALANKWYIVGFQSDYKRWASSPG
uniref:Putative LOV domain-containing protein n=1 Tax=Sphagnum lescurii TaxID=128211 RepID=A0A126WXH2_9BRYO|nr:putative LOV domain-containing protein [Sphagnum lescurii]